MPNSVDRWRALADDMQSAVRRFSPDWTDPNDTDPGVTLLQLFAFMTESLLYRADRVDERGRRLARRLADSAGAIAAAGGDGAAGQALDDCGGGLRQVRYFTGQLLGVDDLEAEQAYLIDRLRRRNRLLHGTGIVCGLEPTLAGDAGTLTVSPGLAFDPRGNEVCVDRPISLNLPAPTDTRLLVLLRYAEHPCRSVPVPAGAPGDRPATEATRTAEGFAIALASTPAADAVSLARLRPVRGRWRLEAGFRPLRVRRA